jgi:hypothetical protein
LEWAHERFINGEHGTSIIKFATVIWRREQSDQLPLAEELIAVFDDLKFLTLQKHFSSFYNVTHLVCSANQVKIMLLKKLGHNIRSKSETDATLVLVPTSDVFVRVRPQQVTDQASIRHVWRPHSSLDLVHV